MLSCVGVLGLGVGAAVVVAGNLEVSLLTGFRHGVGVAEAEVVVGVTRDGAALGEGPIVGGVTEADDPPKCSSNMFLSWSSLRVASSNSVSAYSRRSNESSAPIKRSSRLSSGCLVRESAVVVEADVAKGEEELVAFCVGSVYQG